MGIRHVSKSRILKLSLSQPLPALSSRIQDLKERLSSRGYSKANLVVVLPQGAGYENQVPENVSIFYETEDVEHLATDSVTVVDACGLVVYSIFHPWSSLQYPYVKAAILSAMFDQPCCDKGASDKPMRHPLFDRPSHGKDIVLDLDSPDKGSRQALDDIAPQNASTPEPEDVDAEYLIPLRVIIPAEHVHRDTENPFGKFKKYNYYVLKTDNVSFHGHLDTDPPEIVGIWRDLIAGVVPLEEEEPVTDEDALEATTILSSAPDVTTDKSTTNSISDEEPVFGFPGSSKITFTSSNDLSPTQPLSSTTPAIEPAETPQTERPVDPLVYVNDQSDKFKVRKKYRFGEENASVYNPRDFDEVEVLREQIKTFIQVPEGEPDNKNVPRKVDEHYGNIIPWLDFIL